MGTQLYNIGITGLNAAQAGLITTGHNISNAATPGFTGRRSEPRPHPANPARQAVGCGAVEQAEVGWVHGGLLVVGWYCMQIQYP